MQYVPKSPDTPTAAVSKSSKTYVAMLQKLQEDLVDLTDQPAEPTNLTVEITPNTALEDNQPCVTYLDFRTETRIDSATAVVVPAGARHNIRNTGHKPLKFYTLYAPPEHADGTVHRAKAEAERAATHPTGS